MRQLLDDFERADDAPRVIADPPVLESGFVPWWAPEGLRLALFRPLTSLTHALDHALWPSSPPMMHVQSIAWYALVVALAAMLYQRLLGPTAPRAAAIADHLRHLGMAWWALGRVDELMRYSDATWAKLRASGLKMIFAGAESGSDAVLARMNKGVTVEQVARVTRAFADAGVKVGLNPTEAGERAMNQLWADAVRPLYP